MECPPAPRPAGNSGRLPVEVSNAAQAGCDPPILVGETSTGRAIATYAWTGISWVDIHVAPPPLYAASLVYDPSTRHVLLIGRKDPQWSNGQTWQFTGQSWINVNAVIPHLDDPWVAPDVKDGSVVLVQSAPDGDCAETWVFNGRWTEALGQDFATPCGLIVASATGPVGLTANLPSGTNIWVEWNGRTWTSRVRPGGPRFLSAGAYDPITRTTLLLGSALAAIPDHGPPVDATFSYSGGAWTSTALPPGLTGRVGPIMVSDPVHHEVALSGGSQSKGNIGGPIVTYADSWVWSGHHWQKIG
jgi:hypothetical protein